MAIARVERMLVEAMMSGALSLDSDVWNIAIVERDIPCSALAIKDLAEKYRYICELAASSDRLPEIKLQKISIAFGKPCRYSNARRTF